MSVLPNSKQLPDTEALSTLMLLNWKIDPYSAFCFSFHPHRVDMSLQGTQSFICCCLDSGNWSFFIRNVWCSAVWCSEFLHNNWAKQPIRNPFKSNPTCLQDIGLHWIEYSRALTGNDYIMRNNCVMSRYMWPSQALKIDKRLFRDAKVACLTL